MKRILYLSLFFASFLWAEGTSNIQVIGPFSGLNNTDNPAAIADDKAQDLLNVDLSLGGKSVFKRKGYATALTLSVTTSPVHGTFQFYDSSGNDVVLAFNDTRMTSSVNGGSPTVLFSTGANGATYQCTDSQGYAYCANTSRTSLIKTDGVTYSLITTVLSTGTIVSVTPDRLVLSGFSDNPNRIDFSAAADFTSWTTGVNPLSAFGFTITAPGPKITHHTYAFNRIMWFKSNSFGYILPGQTQADWVVKTISPNVGTLDNTSVYDKGILYFRGTDGNIWSYDGAVLDDLTRDIGGTIDVSQNRISGSWTQSTSDDFNNGYLSNVDTTTIPNAIALSFAPSFATATYDANSSAVGINNVSIAVVPGCTLSAGCSGPYYQSSSFTAAGNYILKTISIRLQDVGSSSITGKLNFCANNGGVPGTVLDSVAFDNDTTLHVATLTFTGNIPVSSGTIYWVQLQPTGICTTTNYYSWYGDATGTGSSYCGSSIVSRPSYFAVRGATYTETGTYQSQVKNSPNLTSWDAFSANYISPSSTHTFSIRAASGSFTVNSSTPSWSTITNGSIPTSSTGPYFQIRDILTTSNSTSTPVLYDLTQYWFEGQAVDKSYATYFKEAVWFSVAAGTGATTNNRILRLDLLNKTWLIYDLPVNGFYIRNNALYFGSSNAGYLFKYGDVDNDNGSAINAYWKSKDFFQASPFTDDDMTDLSVFFKAVDNSTMTMTYSVVGSSESSYQVPMQRSNAAFGKNNRNLPLGTSGNTFNVKFGNNAIDQFFEVFAIQYGYNPKSWKPEK